MFDYDVDYITKNPPKHIHPNIFEFQKLVKRGNKIIIEPKPDPYYTRVLCIGCLHVVYVRDDTMDRREPIRCSDCTYYGDGKWTKVY